MADFKEINASNFSSEVLQSSVPVLLEFGAPWCSPCKMLEPVLLKLGQKWSSKVRLAKINVDECPELSTRLGVMGVPTVILFTGGKEQDRITGFQPETNLQARFGPKIE